MQFQNEKTPNAIPFRLLLMTIVRNWKPSSTRNKLILYLTSLLLKAVAVWPLRILRRLDELLIINLQVCGPEIHVMWQWYSLIVSVFLKICRYYLTDLILLLNCEIGNKLFGRIYFQQLTAFCMYLALIIPHTGPIHNLSWLSSVHNLRTYKFLCWQWLNQP